MNKPNNKAVWWYAVAGVLFYALVTFAAASMASMADGQFPIFRRFAADVRSIVPGASFWDWMDWKDTVGEFSVTMAIALLLAIPMGLAIYLARSNRAQREHRNAAIRDERLRERTRQKMRKDQRRRRDD